MEEIHSSMNFYGWLCWFSASLLFMIQYGLQIFPEVNISQLQHHFHIGETEIGVFSSVFIGLYVIMQIPAGILLDKFKSQYLLIFSALLLCLGCVTLITTQYYYVAILSHILMGLGAGSTFLGTIYVAKRRLASKMFPLAVSLTQIMLAMASIIFTIILNHFKKIYSWQNVLLGVAIFLLLWSLVILLVLKEETIYKSITSDSLGNLRSVLRNKYIWLLGLFLGLNLVHIYVMANLWGIRILEIRYQLSPLVAEIENSLLIIGFIIGTLAGYLLIQLFQRRSVLLSYAILQFIMIGIALYAFLPNYLQVIVLFISGLATGSTFLCFDLARKCVAETMYGVTAGFINTFFGFFSILNIILVSYLLQKTGYNIHIAVVPVFLSSFFALLCALGIYKYTPAYLATK